MVTKGTIVFAAIARMYYIYTASNLFLFNMTQLSKTSRNRRWTKSNVTPEETNLRQAQRHELGARCRTIFESLRPQLIDNHYNWFIAIDAESENYLIDPKLEGLLQQIRARYTNPDAKLTIFRLNEIGACGTI
ncbi:MAG: hypothetical protein ACYT04_37480 [Nostoc sp.]